MQFSTQHKALLAEYFEHNEISPEAIQAFCATHNLQNEPSKEDIEDFVFQAQHDRIALKVFNEMLVAMQGLKYLPLFSNEETAKDIIANNNSIIDKVAEIYENNKVSFIMIDSIGKEFGRMLYQVPEKAGDKCYIDALSAMKNLARERFGGELNMGHVKDYREELYAKSKENGSH